MTKLCPRGKAAAKRKFKVYPSAYANAYASKICAGKIKDPSGVKRKDFRGSKAEGGLMEATSRLKRQGLKDGKKVFPTHPSREQEARDYYTKLYGSKKAKAELGERTRDRRKVKKMGGGMIRQGLKEGKSVKDVRKERALKSQKKTIDSITGFFNKATFGLTKPKKTKVKKMGGGMISKPRAMYRKGGGVCLRGMNREAVGKNS